MRRYPTYKPRSLRRKESKTTRKIILNFIIALVFVYVLINWGLPFIIGGLSSFNKLKPKPQVIKAEEDAAIAPPVLNIPYEATNTAVIKITGYSSPDSKVEIYVDEELKATVNTQSDGSFTAESIPLSLGTNNINGKTINDQNKKSLSSKNIRLIYSNDKPKINLTEPQEGQEVKGGDQTGSSSNKKIKVSGKSDVENTVSINGSTLVLSSDGSFSTEVALNEGDNNITATATNQFGNSTSVSKTVKYTP